MLAVIQLGKQVILALGVLSDDLVPLATGALSFSPRPSALPVPGLAWGERQHPSGSESDESERRVLLDSRWVHVLAFNIRASSCHIAGFATVEGTRDARAAAHAVLLAWSPALKGSHLHLLPLGKSQHFQPAMTGTVLTKISGNKAPQ